MLKGTGSFQWTAEADQAFKQLKQALLIAPVLALLNFTLPFVIEVDASRVGIRAILMQQDHPLAFISKALSPIHQKLSVYDKEMMSIMFAIKKWHHFLVGRHFIIKTNH